ncbi:MAG: flagellar L-ring protein precursor FlgH [Bermanella sp.]|jgi:flagellar L-ring protein precursor FlgH|uniref:flagellar basal body L-ring protein FlgH n=1 Tax=Glaciecola sp. 33A TaxID=2057807 RepID=UPI000C32303F|nr:flagellar basal body L-ring protein FlgH [Glaciecola sp. 33A]PKH99739.1 flagellar basal body L-ring protein FlgH [Glaciecola sp. 33A]
MKLFSSIGLFITAIVSLTGCESTAVKPVTANDPYYAPAVPTMTRDEIVEDGSLFNKAMANSLYSDVKARRVGDIITVRLSENTNASKSAGTTTSKESTVDINPIIGLGGNVINIGKDSIQLGVDSSSDFSGDAQANQSNSLTGNISVTVVEVLPNQNLIIRGEKWLTLNNGDEYIRLTGVIRAADISPSNQIQSTKIANARIQYSAKGSFSQSQEKGWLTKFFSSTWWPL